MENWVKYSVRGKMLSGYIVTRWQSKYSMLQSMISNSATIRRMCRDDLVEHKSVHGLDLTNEEWKILEVFTSCFQLRGSFYNLLLPFGSYAGGHTSLQAVVEYLSVYGR